MSADVPHYGIDRPAGDDRLVDDPASGVRRPLHLTFDDGPDPEWTPQVLDLLARYEATATFFTLGWRMREHPELVDEVLAAGHDVELHGDAHLDHEVAGLGDLIADTDAALGLLRGHGVIPQWWRLPFGRAGQHTASLAKAHGLRIVGWDVDTVDWRGDGWGGQHAAVRAAGAHGGVVLLHDAVAPGTPRAGAENTLEIVAGLLQEAARHQTLALPLPPAALAGDTIPATIPGTPFSRSAATMRGVQEPRPLAALRRRVTRRS